MNYKDYFFNTIILNNEPEFSKAKIKEEDFLRFLLKNNIFNIFYSYTNNYGFKNKYKSLNIYNIITNQYVKDEISKLLTNYDKKIIFLKGISLFETIYSKNLNRHISDVDLLVEDYHSFKEYLYKNGYKKVGDYKETFRKKNIKIDVHTDLINSNRNIFQSKIINLNSKELILKNLIQLKDNIYRLNNELEYLYLITHLFIHHNISYLKWLTDIFIYNKNMVLNKRRLIYLLNETGVNEIYIFFEKIFYNCLNLRIINKRRIFSDCIYNIIGHNRYAIHFFFLSGLETKIKYLIFIINYLITKRRQNG